MDAILANNALLLEELTISTNQWIYSRFENCRISLLRGKEMQNMPFLLRPLNENPVTIVSSKVTQDTDRASGKKTALSSVGVTLFRNNN